MRALTVFPSYAYWPQVLPTVQLFQLLHNDKDVQEQRKRQKFFLIVAVVCCQCLPFPRRFTGRHRLTLISNITGCSRVGVVP